MKTRARTILTDLLTLPTSPFNEQYVAGYIRQWAAGHKNARLTTDEFGNLRLRLKRGKVKAARPIAFSAHMDHPGFEAVAMTGPKKLKARWRGGVAPEFFVGSAVRFYSAGQWIKGIIEDVTIALDARRRRRVETAGIAVKKPVAPESIGMWDFPDPRIKGTRLYARGCDDVAGVAAVMAAIDILAAGRSAVDVYATFTRAEEVGFAGAIAGAQNGLLPRNTRIVAVETSSEIPGVQMGNGPILRVGDKDAIFTPALTAYCRHVAEDLADQDKGFKFQRKLMDGGTCESAAFCEYGYDATGLCIALGNYHNVDRQRNCIGPEYIDLNDWDGLVKWFVALGTSKRAYEADGNPVFRQALKQLDRTYTPLLLKTAERTRRTPSR